MPTPEATRAEVRVTRPGEVRAWLEAHVTYDEDRCLVFPYYRNARGYGVIGVDGRTTRAHQWMCQAAHGAHPSDKTYALHSCGNGHLGCVNPKHLYWGTPAENYQDQVRHGVAAIGERSGKAKLSRGVVLRIRALRDEGKGISEIARHVQAQREAVRSVLRGRTWAWL